MEISLEGDKTSAAPAAYSARVICPARVIWTSLILDNKENAFVWPLGSTTHPHTESTFRPDQPALLYTATAQPQ